MATNIDVTLKRYNEQGEYDIILPTTHLGQIYVDNTLEEGQTLSDFLTNTYINVNKIGAANGLATLDANQKLTLSQLPNGITGGLKFGGTLTQAEVDGVGTTLAGKIDTLHQNVGIGNFVGLQGSYFVATEEITFVSSPQSVQAGSTGRYYSWTQADPNEEGVTGGDVDTITLEIGDWLLIRNIGGLGDSSVPFLINFATINNTYGNASTDEHGIVQLSGETDTTGITNKVITEAVLGNLIGTAANTIAAGDHLHDDRYYTETEIGNYFDGTTAISGYNKTNWDTAHGWGDHSTVGYLTDESLADLTDTTLTDLAANNILRYNGTAWVNDGNFKPILYGTGQTSSIPGAIIIETD